MLVSTAISKLNEILSAHGDLELEGQIRFVASGMSSVAQGAVHGIIVIHEEDTFKKVLITSDDGNAA